MCGPYGLINVKEENIYELCDENGIESVNLKFCKFILIHATYN